MSDAADDAPDALPPRRRPPVVLTTGGTGGHMAPAAGLAAELLRRGRPVVLITDRRGAGFGDRYGAALAQVRTLRIAAGSPSGTLRDQLRGIGRLALGLLQSLWHLAWLRPAAVVGFGSYASVPALVAAVVWRRPIVLHEQNGVLGRAHRALARFASALALPFEPVRGAERVPATLRHVTGNPVRGALAVARAAPYRRPDADGPVRILVTGGSQGASVFADVVPAACALLPEALQRRLRIAQQCRPEDLDRVRDAYLRTFALVELAPFITDVPKRLADVHVVIARAGASTVSELTMAGRPSILVPYAHAMDDHQSANAEVLSRAGAAWVMTAHGPQPSFTAEGLSLLLEGLVGEPELLATAAAAAWHLGRPDAAAALADTVEAVITAAAADRRSPELAA